MFSTKYYELIACCFNNCSFNDKPETIAKLLSDVFEEDNPRFNRKKFLLACGFGGLND
jgi:hypothetical protein